jgi:hypothetical protein
MFNMPTRFGIVTRHDAHHGDGPAMIRSSARTLL